jgi:hypothetical protein
MLLHIHLPLKPLPNGWLQHRTRPASWDSLQSAINFNASVLVIFFLTAALTITTYVSGSDAQEALKETPDMPLSLISAHEARRFWPSLSCK